MDTIDVTSDLSSFEEETIDHSVVRKEATLFRGSSYSLFCDPSTPMNWEITFDNIISKYIRNTYFEEIIEREVPDTSYPILHLEP
jgi:hypothetical protein